MTNPDSYCYSIRFVTAKGFCNDKYIIAHNVCQVLNWGNNLSLNINEATIEEVSSVLGPIRPVLNIYTFTLVNLDTYRKISIFSESVQDAFNMVTEQYLESRVIKIELNEMTYLDITQNDSH